jgi:hypothetical protein
MRHKSVPRQREIQIRHPDLLLTSIPSLAASATDDGIDVYSGYKDGIYSETLTKK